MGEQGAPFPGTSWRYGRSRPGGSCSFVGNDPLAMRDAMGDAMRKTERHLGCRGRRGSWGWFEDKQVVPACDSQNFVQNFVLFNGLDSS